MSKEVRYVPLAVAELRVAGEGDDEKVRGYAAVFDSFSEDLGGFKEKIQRGAFKRSLKENDVVALWQHDARDPLGRMSNGLLSLKEDERGLAFEIEARAFSPRQLEKVRDGTVSQMSFGFITREDKWEKKSGEHVRTLVDVELLEVSPVTWPAYRDTTAAVRSMESWAKAEPKDGAGVVDVLRRRLDLDAAA